MRIHKRLSKPQNLRFSELQNLQTSTMTYSQATQRLQEIVASLESGTLNVDSLAAQIKEAQQLLAFCKERLTATSQELENILNNEQE